MTEIEPRHTTKARQLRNGATPAERRLWRALSARKIAGIRFNRQVSIGPFICDFAARSAKLVIELDGGQHDTNQEQDAVRTRFLESRGFRVIRFWNNDVMERTDGVLAEIEQALCALPSPNPSRLREGS